jgi:hypothetical protein
MHHRIPLRPAGLHDRAVAGEGGVVDQRVEADRLAHDPADALRHTAWIWPFTSFGLQTRPTSSRTV